MSGKDAVKTWLADRFQRLFGVRRLEAQLAQICEQLQAAAASACQRAASDTLTSSAEAILAALDGIEQQLAAPIDNRHLLLDPRLSLTGPADVSPTSVPSPVPRTTAKLDDLRRLENQGLFILGCARSGTTILTRSLNRAPDLILLEEPSFFLNQHVNEFVSFFNQLHASMGNRCMKSTYLPPPRTRDGGPIDTLSRLAEDYRYVGEKVAVGPHDYPANWCQLFLDFQGKYFLRGKYIYIVRTPVESIWSMHKMFPDRPIAHLFETWLRTIALSLDAYHVFPNSRVVFFEDVDQQLVERLGRWLELPIPGLPGTFGRKYIYSALSPGEIPEPLAPFADQCHECTAIYRDLRESFSRDEFVYCGSATEWAYFNGLFRRIEQAIECLPEVESHVGGQLRLAA